MALINCEECSAEISNKAKACPKCGNPNSREVKVYTDRDGNPRPPYDWEIKKDSLFQSAYKPASNDQTTTFVKCTCGNKVNTHAKACPVCGAPEWKIKDLAKKAYLASLSPEQLEIKRQNEEKAKEANKKVGIIIGGIALAIAVMGLISNTRYHSKPAHGKITATDSLAHMSGWNETMRRYSESDSRQLKCGSIKANHKALVSFSNRSTSQIKVWEKRWRDNKCRNGVKYPLF